MKNDKELAANQSRRTCLKIMSGAVVGSSTLASATAALAHGMSLQGSGSRSADKLTATLPADLPIPNLTINININRDDLVDWMMIENLREKPLILKHFAPRWLVYNDMLLDLDAMLSRQQRGREQLEIWPNYAWNHSVRGAVRPLHDCCGLIGDRHDVNEAAAVAHAGVRSLQVPCSVDEQGIVTLLSV